MLVNSFPKIVQDILKQFPKNDYPVLNSRLYVECWLAYALDKSLTSMRDLFKRINNTGIDVSVSKFSKANKHRSQEIFQNVYHQLNQLVQKKAQKKLHNKYAICPIDSTVITLTSKLLWIRGHHQVKLFSSLNLASGSPEDNMKLTLCASLIMGLGISILTNVKAYAANFNFTQITQIDNPFSSPIINNAGTVAFSGTLDNGMQGIFTSNGSGITTIATIGETYSRLSDLSINDAGTVAFEAQLNDGGYLIIPDTEIVIVPGNGIFTSNGQTTNPIRVIPRMETSRGFGTVVFSPSINNGGTVAYLEYNRPVTNVRTSDGRTVGGSIPSIPLFQQPVINDAGDIAYIYQNTVFINNGITDIPVANPNDSINIGYLAFNNQGSVAFTTFNYGIGSKLLINNGSKETTLADTNGDFSNLFSVAINDQGTVAFEAILDNGSEGIFTGSNPLKDKVIATGDPLLGSTLTNVGFSRQGLNNSGQIVFYATLANGRSGIFLADPQLVQPEPVTESTHTLAILAFGVFAASSILKVKSN